jgi:hypothetical protein
MRQLILAALMACAVAGFTAPEQAQCSTDSECLELCPAYDLDCDGGPQS